MGQSQFVLRTFRTILKPIFCRIHIRRHKRVAVFAELPFPEILLILTLTYSFRSYHYKQVNTYALFCLSTEIKDEILFPKSIVQRLLKNLLFQVNSSSLGNTYRHGMTRTFDSASDALSSYLYGRNRDFLRLRRFRCLHRRVHYTTVAVGPAVSCCGNTIRQPLYMIHRR